MKKLLVIFVLVGSVSASADSWRPVSTDDLTCTGTMAGQPDITLEIQAAAGSNRTNILIKQAGETPQVLMAREDLGVGSEGNVYIQQVSNELGYNLFLSGEGLEEVLAGETKQVSLTGSLNLFNDGLDFRLSCSGTLH